MSKEPIKIAIVEDHNLVRESLASLLDQVPEFEVIYHVPTSEELMSRLTWKEQPDVFLVDYNLKKCFGDQCVRAIREKLGEEVKILGLSFHKEEPIIQKMLQAGANGFVFKDYHFDDFKEAINSVYSNGYHINQDVTQMLMKGISGPPASAEEPLTNTEIRILELICEQLTNEEIADKLNLSRHTIHTYRNRILTKTGSSNTAGLVVYAIKNGMYHLQS